jgi:hypothetical protein
MKGGLNSLASSAASAIMTASVAVRRLRQLNMQGDDPRWQQPVGDKPTNLYADIPVDRVTGMPDSGASLRGQHRRSAGGEARSTSMRRASGLRAFVMAPCRRLLPLECSEGMRPR